LSGTSEEGKEEVCGKRKGEKEKKRGMGRKGRAPRTTSRSLFYHGAEKKWRRRGGKKRAEKKGGGREKKWSYKSSICSAVVDRLRRKEERGP